MLKHRKLKKKKLIVLFLISLGDLEKIHTTGIMKMFILEGVILSVGRGKKTKRQESF